MNTHGYGDLIAAARRGAVDKEYQWNSKEHASPQTHQVPVVWMRYSVKVKETSGLFPGRSVIQSQDWIRNSPSRAYTAKEVMATVSQSHRIMFTHTRTNRSQRAESRINALFFTAGIPAYGHEHLPLRGQESACEVTSSRLKHPSTTSRNPPLSYSPLPSQPQSFYACHRPNTSINHRRTDPIATISLHSHRLISNFPSNSYKSISMILSHRRKAKWLRLAQRRPYRPRYTLLHG